jgi:hypothetical protein
MSVSYLYSNYSVYGKITHEKRGLETLFNVKHSNGNSFLSEQERTKIKKLCIKTKSSFFLDISKNSLYNVIRQVNEMC